MDTILALETTEKFGSIALLDGSTLSEPKLLEEVRLPRDKRSAQTLAPVMDTLLRNHSVEPEDVKLVAVVTGPGSFTGLRVGVTAAKMFAWATGAEVVGYRTELVVAKGVLSLPRNELPPFLSVGVDVQRGDVSAMVFELEPIGRSLQYRPVIDSGLISVSNWWRQAEQWEGLCFTGPALMRYANIPPENVRLINESLWMPRASMLGTLAVVHLEYGEFPDNYLSLSPIYSRLSAAEERQSKIGG